MAKPSLVYDCPKCSTQNQGFAFLFWYRNPVDGHTVKVREERRTGAYVSYLAFQCIRCYWPVFVGVLSSSVHDYSGQPLQLTPNYDKGGIAVFEIRPESKRTDVSPHYTPDTVARPHDQGCRALTRGDWDAAGMCFRKALDISTKALIRAAARADAANVIAHNLYGRIEWLHQNHKLTDELKDWAHFIRIDGNEAAHEEEPVTESEARQLHNFTEVFLTYVFSIPGMIKEKRGETQSDQQ